MTALFYPTLDGTYLASTLTALLPARPVLLSAQSIATARARKGEPLPCIPVAPQVTEIAVDPGGFAAQVRGGYSFSWDAYVRFLRGLGPRLTWAAFPDLPCEKELAPAEREVEARQQQTLAWAWELWGGADDTENDSFDALHPWSWVATIQGRTLPQYVKMAVQLVPLLRQQVHQYAATAYAEDLYHIYGEDRRGTRRVQRHQARAAHNATHARLAIGSLCRREKVGEIVAIVQAVSEILPDERFHLWGVKLDALDALRDAGLLPVVASLDSSAWNARFGSDIPVFEQGRARLGLSQRAYALTKMLPAYIHKVERALHAPTTTRLL